MDAREQRGLEIAAVSKIQQDDGVWYVPSQTTGGRKYQVYMDGPEARCSCPDHEVRHCKCKHIYAVHCLCADVEDPIQTFGRPRLPLAEQAFCATYKVYSTVSSRRFITDLDEARAKGYLSKTPHFNSVLNAFDAENLTPVLQELIQRSSLPLKAIESDFAVDSTGFSSSRFEKWFDVKRGGKVSSGNG